MKTLEDQFTKELIKNYEIIEKETGIKSPRLNQVISKFGGVKTAKELLRKNRISDEFEKIQAAGYVKLTLEALVIDCRYAELFTDEEVNSCYDLLCEYNYL